MEEWQRKHIEKHGVELSKNIKITERLLERLVAAEKLTDDEMETILAKGTRADKCFEFLRTVKIKPCYYEVVAALNAELQEGAVAILENHAKYRKTTAERADSSKNTRPAAENPQLQMVDGTSENLPHESKGFRSLFTACVRAPDEADTEESYVEEYYKNHFGKVIEVRLEESSKPKARSTVDDPYQLPRHGKGIAFVVNISEFSNVEYNRKSGDLDGIYMTKLLTSLGYKIFADCQEKKVKWTKQELLASIDKFKMECDKPTERPKSIVVYISSHGSHDHIVPSDCTDPKEKSSMIELYSDIILKFHKYSTNYAPFGSKHLGTVPKIFCIDACQHFVEFNVMNPSTKDITESTAPFDNALIAISQVTGHKSYEYETFGSFFTHCFTFVVMKYAKTKSLQEMMNMISNILKSKTGQNPSLTYNGLRPLYFNV